MTDSASAVYRATGFTDDVTECEICGKTELRGTMRLVVVTADNEEDGEVYAGSHCASKLAGRPVKELITEAKQADRKRLQAARDLWNTWSAAHHDWFMARRLADLGPNPKWPEISRWNKTESYKEAEAEWITQNPPPPNPWGSPFREDHPAHRADD